MKRVLTSIIVICFFLIPFSSFAYDINTFFTDSFKLKQNSEKILKKSQKRAKRENKNILIVVGDDSCVWTRLLQKAMLYDSKLLRFIENNFIILKINYRDKFFTNKYFAPSSTPYFFILDSDGNLLKAQRASFFEERKKSYDKLKVLKLLASVSSKGEKKRGDYFLKDFSLNYDINADIINNFKEAKNDAKKYGLNIFVIIGSKSCSWCNTFDDFILNNKQLSRLVYDNFIVLKLHSKHQKIDFFFESAQIKEKPLGIPYLLFLDSEGKVIKKQPTAPLERVIRGYNSNKLLYFFKKWDINYKQNKNPLREKFPAFSMEYNLKSDAFDDFRKAKKKATKESKNIFVIVGDINCIWTDAFDDFFLKHKSLNTFLHNNFVVLKVVANTEEGRKFIKGFEKKMPPLPHIFILNREGELKKSVSTALFETKDFMYDKLKLKRFLKSIVEPF